MYGYLHNNAVGRIIAPMHTERLSDDVYVFTSELYYQVTASLIVSGTIGVLIDTLPFPEETVQIAQLVNRLCPDGVRYIIYTQHQADHVYGAAFFPRAEVISHTLCRDLMIASYSEAQIASGGAARFYEKAAGATTGRTFIVLRKRLSQPA